MSLLLAGCTTYYQVSDPTTGKRYYATAIDTERDGAVTLTDERSGAAVTIQNSEIIELKQGAYEAAVAALDTAPTPMAAPPVAPAPVESSSEPAGNSGTDK